ncbi:MAG TPA: glutamyl-tRNA reductase, partial [Campylobacterales bacterium]|nr:glutamyl-tRNA reductase [Campylobacterales bacterium]
ENVRGDSVQKLPKYLNRYRLLFAATSASDTVIKSSMIENENMDRVWFDMAIPRDIDEIEIEKIRLFRIDDLRSISNDNYALKQEQALQAMEIVKRYEQEFYQWLRALSIEPVIKTMRLQVKEAIDKELDRAIDKKFVPETYRENMQKMAEQMFNRFLHDPTQELRKSSAEKNGLNKVEAIKEIFDISTENIDFKQYKEEHHKKGYEQ